MKRDDDQPTLEVKPRLTVDPPDGAKTAAASAEPAVVPAMVKAANTMRTIRRVVSIIGVVVAGLVMLLRFISSSHGLGDFVTDASQCRSGKMMQTSGGRLSIGGICTKDCSGDDACGKGFQCHDGNCLPRGATKVGEDCDHPWDCESFKCIGRAPGPADFQAYQEKGTPIPHAYCTKDCGGGDGACPDGYSCARALGGDFVCSRIEAGGLDGMTGNPDVDELLRKIADAQRQLKAASPPAQPAAQ